MPELTAVRGRRPLRDSPWLPVAVQVLAVLVVFAVVGALCGWLWQHLWTPPQGVVADHVWYTDEEGLRGDFSGTGLYVVIALLAGFAVGGLTSFFCDRAELATLLAVAAGAALAAWLMWQVGVHASPADPHEAAKSAADGTKLSGELHVSGLAPFIAFPVGALSALTIVFFGLTKRRSRRV